MFRLVAASRAVREAVPAEVLPVVLAVTALGGAKVPMVGLSLAYWNAEDHREELLAVVATAFLALAVTLSLKWGFGLPRPPSSAYRSVTPDSPVGFPSGHTIAATTVYGGALVAFDRHRDLRVAVPVAGVVASVGLSRVVLGVHYLGDVVAGAAVGSLLLGALVVALRRGPAVVFGLATVCAVPALFVAGDPGNVALALGGSLGGFLATLRWSATERFRSGVERVALSVAGLAFLAGALVVAEGGESNVVLAGGAYCVLAVGIVVLPGLVGRVDALAGRSSAGE